MAGSYNHATTDDGKLRAPGESMGIATENGGDSYETIEEMYGMIWFLAGGDPHRVEMARQNYKIGIEAFSPGREGDAPSSPAMKDGPHLSPAAIRVSQWYSDRYGVVLGGGADFLRLRRVIAGDDPETGLPSDG